MTKTFHHATPSQDSLAQYASRFDFQNEYEAGNHHKSKTKERIWSTWRVRLEARLNGLTLKTL